MNMLKYGVLGITFGACLAFTTTDGLAQRLQVQQQPSSQATPPVSVPRPAPTDVSDLPIGVQQGLSDAKRYQELRQRALRQGQTPPPLPYASPTVLAPMMPGYPPPQSSGRPTGAPQPWLILPPTPAMEEMEEIPQPTQPLQFPTSGRVSPNLTFRQVPPPQPTPEVSPALRQLQELQQYVDGLMSGQGGAAIGDPGQITAPAQPRQGGTIQMSSPSPQGVRLGSRP